MRIWMVKTYKCINLFLFAWLCFLLLSPVGISFSSASLNARSSIEINYLVVRTLIIFSLTSVKLKCTFNIYEAGMLSSSYPA